ncbi:MAG: hypothetical protein RL712_673, partial [Bacteroidota bacterium]
IVQIGQIFHQSIAIQGFCHFAANALNVHRFPTYGYNNAALRPRCDATVRYILGNG